jgi:hypothetical protein
MHSSSSDIMQYLSCQSIFLIEGRNALFIHDLNVTDQNGEEENHNCSNVKQQRESLCFHKSSSGGNFKKVFPRKKKLKRRE